jgi:enterochelin esterase family protein
MIVYLPSDYYSSGRRYPVLYLLHGARGYETSWIRKGQVYQSTDSLFQEGQAEPCIVVMPNVNQYNNDRDYEGGRLKGAWESILEVDGTVEYAFVHDVVNLVDSLYRTVPDKAHRAVAGLSIGGYQSLYLGVNHPDIFGYICAMSPYTWCKGRDRGYKKQFYGHLYQKMDAMFTNSPPMGLYLYAGKCDIMRPSTEHIHHRMKKKNHSHEYSMYPGGHDWKKGWIEEYKDMLKKLFK